MKKLFTAVLLLFVFGVAANAAAKNTDNGNNYDEAFRLIDVWLDAQRDFDRLPGISLAIVEDQETIWTGAYGCANVEDGIPSTPNTIGSICSFSKLFTSISIMKLYEETLLGEVIAEVSGMTYDEFVYSNIIHYTLFQMHSVRKEHQTGR